MEFEEEERLPAAAAFFAARADPFAAAAVPPVAADRSGAEEDESFSATSEGESLSDFSELFAEEEECPAFDLQGYLRERDKL